MPPSSAPESSLPSRLPALRSWLANFSRDVRQRGFLYHHGGRVHRLVIAPDGNIAASVQGTLPYEVTLTYTTPPAWNAACTCPVGSQCKHIYAAGLALAERLEKRPPVATTLASQLPAAKSLTPPMTEPFPTFSRAAAPTSGGQLVTHLETLLGRSLLQRDLQFLGKLTDLHTQLGWQRRIDAYSVQRLLPAATQRAVFYDGAWCVDFWDPERPPATPLDLWQYLAVEFDNRKVLAPDFLAPVTDLPGTRARIAAYQRELQVKSWTDHFERLQARLPAAASADDDEAGAPPPPPQSLRLRLTPKSWRLELRPSPAAAWEELDVAFARTLFARSAALARTFDEPSLRLALAFRDEFAAGGGGRPNPRHATHRRMLNQVLRDPVARTAIVGQEGEPVGMARRKLVWTLEPVEGPGDFVQASLTFTDGSPAPGPLLPLEDETTPLYLHGATVYRGPPSLSPDAPEPVGASPAAESVRLPASVLTMPKALQFFRAAGARLPASVDERVQVRPLRPHLRVWLENAPTELRHALAAGWAERFFAELSGIDEAGVKRELYREATWSTVLPADRPTPPPASARPAGNPDADAPTGTEAGEKKSAGSPGNETDRLIVYDRAATQPAVAAFRALSGLRWEPSPPPAGEGAGRWTRYVAADFPEEFATWIAGFPADLVVDADPELAGLFREPDRASYELDLAPAGESQGRDWFDVRLVLRPEDTTLSPGEIALLLKARGRFVRLEGKGWRRLALATDDATQARLDHLGLDLDESDPDALAEGGTQRFHALQLSDPAFQDVVADSAWAAVRARVAALNAVQPPSLPGTLRAELRPYQLDGFHFLARLSALGLGGVLADDMGLGKTVQALAWLLWLAERQPAGEPFRVLVVCPKSVTTNWVLEAARFAPSLRAELLGGKAATTASGPAADGTRAGAAQITVCNYAQLRLRVKTLTATAWSAVLLDEGQNIKNPGSATAQAARTLRTPHRVVLTGTPVENRLLDLWSLYAFAQPGLLGGQTAFKRLYDDRADPAKAHARLARRVRPFLLRRTKQQVASDLPERIEEDLHCEMEGAQAALYQAELKRARQQLLGIESETEFSKSRFNILQSLLRLRQICCDPRLLGAPANTPSAKLDALFDTLEPLIAEGHKVLVFSQFVSMLELISARLHEATTPHLLLTGQTEDRQTLVDRFQNDAAIPVFLLSLKAAGAGLNLTAASYVVLYDPWWNPAVEAQAIDRTHRIGQKSKVIAYRLLVKDSVEEKIRSLQREKAALASAVVGEEALAQVMTLDALREILA